MKTGYYVKRKSDGKFYSRKPGQYYSEEESQWSDDILDARLYTRSSFAQRSMKEKNIAAEDVDILTFTITFNS